MSKKSELMPSEINLPEVTTPVTSAGRYYPLKSTIAGTVISSGISALFGAGFGYAMSKMVTGVTNKQWSWKPTPIDTASAGFGAVVSGLSAGFNTSKSMQIRNNRAVLLNKYRDQPDIQNDIIQQIGTPDSYQYTPTTMEKFWDNVGNVAMLGWIATGLSDKKTPLNSAVNVGFGASFLGSMGARVIGRFSDARQEQEMISKVSKLALERLNQSKSVEQRSV